MYHREIFRRLNRHGDARDAIRRWRDRGKERERKMAHGIAKFRAVRSVPGIDGIERFQLPNAGVFNHANQIDAGIGDGPRAIGKTDQGKQRARDPDFGVIGSGSFQGGKRKDHVADRARAYQQAAASA